jgi:hypothetical protein
MSKHIRTAGAMRKVFPAHLLAMAQQADRDAELYPTNGHGIDEEPADCTCLRCCCHAIARTYREASDRADVLWLGWGKNSEAWLNKACRNYRKEAV